MLTTRGHAPGTRQPEVRATGSPVEVYSEWDPLEEVIVGSAIGSRFPDESPRMIRATMPEQWQHMFLEHGGERFCDEILGQAQWELDNLARVLTAGGIVVRRPLDLDRSKHRGYTGAMPRDSMIAIGTTIIETPMAWRSRQGEVACFRDQLAEYAAKGALVGCRRPAPIPGCWRRMILTLAGRSTSRRRLSTPPTSSGSSATAAKGSRTDQPRWS